MDVLLINSVILLDRSIFSLGHVIKAIFISYIIISFSFIHYFDRPIIQYSYYILIFLGSMISIISMLHPTINGRSTKINTLIYVFLINQFVFKALTLIRSTKIHNIEYLIKYSILFILDYWFLLFVFILFKL